MHAISSYRGNRPTNKQTYRQDRLQYTAPHLARSTCNKLKYDYSNVVGLTVLKIKVGGQMGQVPMKLCLTHLCFDLLKCILELSNY